jgi:hypothetical protein
MALRLHRVWHKRDCLNFVRWCNPSLQKSGITLIQFPSKCNDLNDDNPFKLRLSWIEFQEISNNIRLLRFWNHIPYGLHHLTKLRLSNTKLYSLNHLRNYTKCLTRLTNINLSGISLRIIPNNIFSKLPFLNKELGSKNPFCAILCVNVKPSALENVKVVKEELLNA